MEVYSFEISPTSGLAIVPAISGLKTVLLNVRCIFHIFSIKTRYYTLLWKEEPFFRCKTVRNKFQFAKMHFASISLCEAKIRFYSPGWNMKNAQNLELFLFLNYQLSIISVSHAYFPCASFGNTSCSNFNCYQIRVSKFLLSMGA